MNIEVRLTAVFENWLDALSDHRARVAIVRRIARLEAGLFGDVKYFDGIGEIRVAVGPGYRVYFVQRGRTLVILLCGGDKASQKKDIRKALAMVKE